VAGANPCSASGEVGMPAVLRLLREYHGLTGHQLADKLGLNHGHYSRVEAGYRNLSFSYWEKVCDIFQLSMGELFTLLYDSIPDDRKRCEAAKLVVDETLTSMAQEIKLTLMTTARSKQLQNA
jgi:transcriptional regulator with XRE-family HTH domain